MDRILETATTRLTGAKVLVTGGTGFIGRPLVRRLAKIADEVRVLALPQDTGAEELRQFSDRVRVIEGDVRSFARVQAACDGIDIVFHCAGVVTDWAPRRLFEDVNVAGTKNVLDAAANAGVRRLVYISTNDVFGLVEGRVIDETFPLIPWGEPYADTKLAAEYACRAAHASGRLEVAMLYPCWVYGPGDRTFVPELARAIAARQLVLWRPDCLVWPMHVENLVDLLLLVATDPRAAGQGYLCHDGTSLTLKDFCQRIADAVGAPPLRFVIPRSAAHLCAVAMESAWRILRLRGRPLLTTYIVKNLGARLQFSIEKARRLGFAPRVGFEEGFAATVAGLVRPGAVVHEAPQLTSANLHGRCSLRV
jgi:nucleoside-diphosphate-sugar epimerase